MQSKTKVSTCLVEAQAGHHGEASVALLAQPTQGNWQHTNYEHNMQSKTKVSTRLVEAQAGHHGETSVALLAQPTQGNWQHTKIELRTQHAVKN